MAAESSLIGETTCRVSSVLNKDVKQFGKQFMFDSSDETCWNSHQGSPQWIQLEFAAPVEIHNVKIMFQGGFVGKDCEFLGSGKDGAWTTVCSFYPQDNNDFQLFNVEQRPVVNKLQILFKNSTDFYGRITIYKIDVLGKSLK